MKCFKDIDENSQLYFLFDPYGCLTKYDNGFANSNFCVQLFSRGMKYFMSYKANNMQDKALNFCIDRDIEYNDVTGKRIISFSPSLTKGEAEKYYFKLNSEWYVFASREGLEFYIHNITDVVRDNLFKIDRELENLK